MTYDISSVVAYIIKLRHFFEKNEIIFKCNSFKLKFEHQLWIAYIEIIRQKYTCLSDSEIDGLNIESQYELTNALKTIKHDICTNWIKIKNNRKIVKELYERCFENKDFQKFMQQDFSVDISNKIERKQIQKEFKKQLPGRKDYIFKRIPSDCLTYLQQFLPFNEVLKNRQINTFFAIQNNKSFSIGSINLYKTFYCYKRPHRIITILNKTKQKIKSYYIDYEDINNLKNIFFSPKKIWNDQKNKKENNMFTKPLYYEIKVIFPPQHKESYWVPISVFNCYHAAQHTFNINLVDQQQIIILNTVDSIFNLVNNTKFPKYIQIVIRHSYNLLFNYDSKNIILNQLFISFKQYIQYNILQSIIINKLQTLSIEFEQIENKHLCQKPKQNFIMLKNFALISRYTIDSYTQQLIVNILLNSQFPSLLNMYIDFKNLEKTHFIKVIFDILLKETKNLFYIKIRRISPLFKILDHISNYKEKTPTSIIIDITLLTKIELQMLTLEIGNCIDSHYNKTNIYFKFPNNETSKNIVKKLQKMMHRIFYTEPVNTSTFYIKSSNIPTQPNTFPAWTIRDKKKDKGVTFLQQTDTKIFNNFLSLCRNITKFTKFAPPDYYH